MPRVPQAHARPEPQASAPKGTTPPKAGCGNTTGAAIGSKLRRFALKAMDVTLAFAEWCIDLAIEVAMESAGQRFRHGKPGPSAKPTFC